ncbi:HPP family protein [uncultured Algibacter sp.]|uniref:HPP family protein n=1 Tax=uncultured Algibacter sp. TaxID=298659 RepID=UPI003216E786
MTQILLSLFNCFIAMACFICIYLCHKFLLDGNENTLVIAAFGASAVLAFSEYISKNSFVKILLASGIGAVIGVFFSQSNLDMMFKISMAIGICILLLNLTRVHYPPVGAIVIIPLISNPEIKELGYLYAIYPTMTGITIIYIFSKIKQKINTIYLLWQAKKQ